MTERRIKNVNLFVTDLANIYVMNTRTLSASTVLSLILLLLLLLFSFSFELIASVFKVCAIVCVYLQVFLKLVLQFLFICKWFGGLCRKKFM